MKKAGKLLLMAILTLSLGVCPVMAQGEEEEASVLVACFSGTGNTMEVADVLSEALGAQLFEIVPEEPYTEEDLNYRDSSSRAVTEQNDADARPAISSSLEEMDSYDVVFLGYPIWCGEAPRIMSTFVESYDFTGKTVVPFCTSGGSGFGKSDAALQEAAPDAVWVEGHRFSAGAAREEILEWAEGLKLPGVEILKEESGMKLTIGDTDVSVEWEANESVEALKELCKEEPLEISMSMYGGFEQVGSIGQSLPRNDEQTVTEPGDLVLYSGDQLVVFYGSNSWAYTRLGHITDQTQEDLTDLLSNGDVTITIRGGEEE